MKKLEIDKVDYDVKPCPLCGRVEFLKVTSREDFEELYDRYGSACITLECDACDLEVYEHRVRERDYHKKVTALVNKWNTRGGGDHEGTEKCGCDCHK